MISEEFGGRVAVESRRGIGSAFLASLKILPESPSVAESEERAVKEAYARQLRAARATLEREGSGDTSSKILVVDDEAYNCEVLKMMIGSLGIADIENRLTVCLGGKEALQAFQENLRQNGGLKTDYRVVLSDLSMPGMDGYKLVTKLKKALRDVREPPVIAALTGHTEKEFISRALQKGMDHVYSKPISQESIQLVLLEGGIQFSASD